MSASDPKRTLAAAVMRNSYVTSELAEIAIPQGLFAGHPAVDRWPSTKASTNVNRRVVKPRCSSTGAVCPQKKREFGGQKQI